MISGWSACRRRIEDGFRALRKRGQSETLGVALLTGVVLILVAVVGLFLFADFGANEEEQLLANIDGDVEATNITLSHEGGDEFAPGEIEVVLTGDVSRELRLNESFDATTGGDGSFAPGDVWKSNSTGLIVGEGRLLVIHTVSDTILLDQPYAIEEDGVDLAVENHPNGNFRSDQATIHGNANWSYDILATLGGTSYEETDNINYTLTFDYQSGTDNGKINWYDDGNHEIEVGDISSQKTVTATATIYRENGIALNETGEVELTVKPEPSFSVTIDDTSVADGSGALSVANQGQFGTQSIGPNELVRGDTLEVTVSVANTNSNAAVTTQQIEMGMGPNSGSGDTMSAGPKSATLAGGESTQMIFTMDVPTSAVPGMHTMEVASEDDTATREIMVNSLPNFEVDILSLNDPVGVGSDLSATVKITNTGTLSDTQDVNFELTAIGGTPLGNQNDSVNDLQLDGGDSAERTLAVPTSSLDEGLFIANITTSGQGGVDTQVAVLLSFSVSFDSVPSDVYASSDDNVSVTAEVSHGLSNLGEQEVETDVTIDPGQLGEDNVTETVSFTDSDPTSKTVDVEFSPNYTDLDPKDYKVTATESATGDRATNNEVTVRKVVMDVSFTGIPDEIDAGSPLDINYNVENSGNVDQDVTVQLVANESTVGDVADDDDSYTALNDEFESGDLTYTSSEISNAGFGPGDTIGLTLKAVNGGELLASDSGSTDIAPIDSGAVDLNIKDGQTDTSVNEGENVGVTSGVSLSLGGTTVGTNALLDDTLVVEIPGLNKVRETDIQVGTTGITETVDFQTGAGDAGTYTIEVSLKGIDGVSATRELTIEETTIDFELVATDASTGNEYDSASGTTNIIAQPDASGVRLSQAVMSGASSGPSFGADGTTDGVGNGADESTPETDSNSASTDSQVGANDDETTYNSPGEATYNVPDDVDYVRVIIQGAGGGSGLTEGVVDTYDGGFVGAAGGDGGNLTFYKVDVSEIDEFEVHVGEGGHGGHLSDNNGSGAYGGEAVDGIVNSGKGQHEDCGLTCGGNPLDPNFDSYAASGSGGGGSAVYIGSGFGKELLGVAGGGGGGAATDDWFGTPDGATGGGGSPNGQHGEASTDDLSPGNIAKGDDAASLDADAEYSSEGTIGGKGGNVEIDCNGDGWLTCLINAGYSGSSGGWGVYEKTGYWNYSGSSGGGADGGDEKDAGPKTGDGAGNDGNHGLVTIDPVLQESDITVTATATSPTRPDGTLDISYSVENNGDTNVTIDEIESYLKGVKKKVKSDETIFAGGTHSGSFSLSHNAVDGETIDWRVELDDGASDDYSWDGKSDSGTTDVVAPGDLAITSFDAPPTVGVKNSLTIDYTVKNVGSEPIGTDLELSLGGTNGPEDSVGVDLDPGKKTEGSLSFDSVEQKYNVGDEIDWTLELANGNDSETGVTEVVGAPDFDLTIDNFDENVTEGEDLTVDYTIENVGTASGTVDVTLKINGNKGSNEHTLDPGESTSGLLTYQNVQIENLNSVKIASKSDE